MLLDREVGGRIMLHPQAPKEQPWFWTITSLEMLTRFPRANYCAKIIRYLRCSRKPADAPELEGVNFRLESIKLWKQRLGRAN